MVDSSDKERLSLTRKELLSMLEEEELKNTILLVFANKMDMKGAATEVEVSQALGLHAIKERSATQHSRTQWLRFASLCDFAPSHRLQCRP